MNVVSPSWLLLGCLVWASSPMRAADSPAIWRHTGMCDASAGAFLSKDLFVAANDEDNVLRIYRRDQDGNPVGVADMSAFLNVEEKHPETDLEGATWLGDRLFWITSHGRNKDGKMRKSRLRFFATEISQTSAGAEIVPVLRPYKNLLSDLMKARSLRSMGLGRASQLAPKEKGGFNIEGLCATPDGKFFIGFRNPIPHGQALIVPFLNPEGVLRGQSGLFGEPILLSLEGYGIRDMARVGSEYLIIAGSYDAEGTSRLYRWDGASLVPELIRGISFQGFNPEALLVDPTDPRRVLVFSDDGVLSVNGVDCKTLADPNERRFRSRWITIPERP